MEYPQAPFRKIKKVLQFVWDSPYSSFYRLKYQKHGVKSWQEIKTLADFKKLPFLTRKELLNTDPEKRIYFPVKNIKNIAVSSGTTDSKTPLILFSKNYTIPKSTLKFFDGLRVKRCLLLFPILQANFRMMWLLANTKGVMVIPGDINNLPLTAKIAKNVKIDSVFTSATTLYYFAPFLKKEYSLSRINHISLRGEYCSEQKFAFLKREFPNAYFDFTYASSEASKLGDRCGFLAKEMPRFFHPLSDTFYELLNPEAESELAITRMSTKANFPLIRYKTGDSVSFQQKICLCGEKIIMEVKGKLGLDMIKIAGAFIYTGLIEQVLLPFTDYLADDWKLHVFEEIHEGKFITRLKLQLIAKNDRKNNQQLQVRITEYVSNNLYISSRSRLIDLVQKGAFLPLEIEFVNAFLPEVKRKRIISHLK
ncbi:MAG: hypothetical protein M1268_04680 [Patescibacteria group bacterium]|nr:hypothetical protein [Patescibacteria group bacterium]